MAAKRQILSGLVLPKFSGKPESPVEGEIHYDTATKTLYWYNGTEWVRASGGLSATPDAARVYKATGQSIPNITVTALTFDTERFDDGGLHSTVSNTSRLTAAKAGVYVISAAVGFVEAGAGGLVLILRVNGTTSIALDQGVAATDTTISTIYKLNAGDYVEVLAFHNSGAAKTTKSNNTDKPQEFAMAYVGEGTNDWGIVTALPSSPSVGDICRYKAGAGVYWDLLYTKESETYPWNKIGGPPLREEKVASSEITAKTFQTTNAPSITAPLACEFKCEAGARLVSLRAAAADNGEIGVHVNGTLKSTFYVIGSAQFTSATINGKGPVTTAAAGQAIQARYKTTNGIAWVFQDIWVELDPIRVG